MACRPDDLAKSKDIEKAGHDCNGRYRRHRRILNAMFTEAGPDSEHSLGKVFADVKAGFRHETL